MDSDSDGKEESAASEGSMDRSPMQKKPVSGCVSMKSDMSVDHPAEFKGTYSQSEERWQPNRNRRRGDSPAPSVSIKSDMSMDHPPVFRETDCLSEERWQPNSNQRRGDSPVPSVSIKSDMSMDHPPVFRETDCLSEERKRRRADSPVPSVSIKSDMSMDHPPVFRETDCLSEERKRRRADSPVPSVSIKSDMSMDHPPVFRETDCLSEERQTPKEEKVLDNLRSTLKGMFQHLLEGVPIQGDLKHLPDIYTELYITKGKKIEVNQEHEVRQIERAYGRKAVEYKPIAEQIPCHLNDIFKPVLDGRNRDASVPTRTVLTMGVAGIGKTVSVQKFIVDWAEGKANQDIHLIFPLPFRELNLLKDTKLSLMELIHYFFPEIKDPGIVTTSGHRVLFIFDGLDEYKFDLDFTSSLSICDVSKPASVNVLLANLIKGQLLPSSLIWITTRPAAANQILDYMDQVTEIKGFSDTQKEDYFRKRFSDENLLHRAMTHLKSSRSLYIMCHIPVFCWILATVIEKISNESEQVEMPWTLTQLYTHFLIIQTSIKKEKYLARKETDSEVVFKLGKLAFQQLEKGNLIFYEQDLKECGIDVRDASVYSGICTQIFREEAGLYQGKVFSFVHLTIQEFLAALYVLLCFSNSEKNIPDQQQTSPLFALFRATTLHELQKTALNLAIKNSKGNLDIFLRFVFGLSLESNQNLLRFILPKNSVQSLSSDETVSFVKKMTRELSTTDNNEDLDNRVLNDSFHCPAVNLFYCLIELNQHAVVEVIESPETLYVVMLLRGQWLTRNFKFKISRELLCEFDLQKYIKTPEKDQTELVTPDDVLQKLIPVVTASTSVLLNSCFLTEKSGSAFASAASSNLWNLRNLNLSDNKLHDAGVQHLSYLLSNPHCKLENLLLRVCSLKEKSCAYLASALSSADCSLKHLDLSHNELHDAGVQHLSELFKHPHCKLETLRLEYCSLTEKSCAILSSAARSAPCSLKELYLCSNKLHDSGVQHLSDLLKNPNWKLEKLDLRSCSLTEESFAALASAISSSSYSLKTLDLTSNRLHDAVNLSDLLKNPHGKLEKLILSSCSLTDKCCAALASAANSTYYSLKELNLTSNEFTYAGVQHLSDLLKNPHCKLQKLKLRGWQEEKSSVALLSAASSPSSNLKELDISDNRLRGVVHHLSDFLKNPLCKLEKIILRHRYHKKQSDWSVVSTVPLASGSLKELDLSGNTLNFTDVQHLSDLIKNSHCKLEKLILCRCGITEESCTVLISAIKSPFSSLKVLDLSRNKIYDAAHHLSNLLKNPHCKLEKLKLCNFVLTEESCTALLSAVSSPSSSLKELDLSSNVFSYTAVKHLLHLIKNPHTKLEKLKLRDSFLTEKICDALVSAVSCTSSSLKELDLSGNWHSDDEDGEDFQDILHLIRNPHDKQENLLIDETRRSCESCTEIPDISHWVQVEPEVSTEESDSTFILSSPSGSYECSESGLRWSCTGPVTLQYCFSDWNVFAEEMAHMQCRPAGPLMDIKLLSGELEEIHLPHFLCLGGCEASVHDAVRVLHGRDSGVCVEVCELTRHHARLLHPSFSFHGVVHYIKSLLYPIHVHSEVLVYQDSMTGLTFRTYLLPEDAHLKHLVERDEEKLGGIWKAKPRPVRPLQMDGFYSLRTDCSSEVNPEELMLRYSINAPNFFEVELSEPAASFHMELFSSSDSRGKPVWRAKFQSGSQSGVRGEQSPRLQKKVVRKGMTSNAKTRDAEGERSTITNTEQVSNVRPSLINGISRGVLMAIVDRLQAHHPPLLSSGEAEEVLQRSQGQQDQVRCLIDIVYRKGEIACGIILDLLKELDPYLHEELCL